MNVPGSGVPSATRARTLGLAVIGMLVIVMLAACGSSSHPASGVKGGSEVKAQAINTSGTNPFTASVAKDHAGIKPPPAAASSSGGPATYVASTPGLYGGTRNISVCDARKLIAFLQQNQSKATAWAGVLGIQQSQISSYVDKLTPVLLRTDTRVTNHGYANGSATTLQAVLQAGTAVLVDQYGRPTVKCYCGNPLTPPVPESSPTYTGTLWPGFSASSITITSIPITARPSVRARVALGTPLPGTFIALDSLLVRVIMTGPAAPVKVTGLAREAAATSARART